MIKGGPGELKHGPMDIDSFISLYVIFAMILDTVYYVYYLYKNMVWSDYQSIKKTTFAGEKHKNKT